MPIVQNALQSMIYASRWPVIDAGYRIDLLVDDVLVVEVKAVAKILPIHEAQVLSYLKLSGRPAALLINFHVLHLRNEIRRLLNGS